MKYNPIEIAPEVYVKVSTLIYRVSSLRQLDSKELSFLVSLDLVCGYDYINPDLSNDMGYVPSDRYTEDWQDDYMTWYPIEESFTECAEEHGYSLLHKLPYIYGGEKDGE